MIDYLEQTRTALAGLDTAQIDGTVAALQEVRGRGGRLFLIGNGGGAGHASHAACDFTKIGRIPSYAWGENVSQLTAWANDASWEASVACWLVAHRCGRDDAVLVFSVGGASREVSVNLKEAVFWAKGGPTLLGIVGAEGGYTAAHADHCIVIPSSSTPIVEGVQAVVWHGLVEALR